MVLEKNTCIKMNIHIQPRFDESIVTHSTTAAKGVGLTQTHFPICMWGTLRLDVEPVCCRWDVLQIGCVADGVCCRWGLLQMGCVADGVCCRWGVLQMGCVADGVCCRWGVLQMGCVADGVCCRWVMLQMGCLLGVILYHKVWVAVCCSVLQRFVVRCSVS